VIIKMMLLFHAMTYHMLLVVNWLWICCVFALC